MEAPAEVFGRVLAWLARVAPFAVPAALVAEGFARDNLSPARDHLRARGVCPWCCAPIASPRRTFCANGFLCRDSFWHYLSFAAVSAAVVWRAGACGACGEPFPPRLLYCHHIYPRHVLGDRVLLHLDPTNLVALCHPCHVRTYRDDYVAMMSHKLAHGEDPRGAWAGYLAAGVTDPGNADIRLWF